LTTPAYAGALNEVKALGSDASSSRTAEQTQIGLFWNTPIWVAWNRIAQTVAANRGDDLETDARAFALLDVTLADATVALYDAKYTFRRWRPVTAIRAADTDGNTATDADLAWTPLSATAPDPSYPGAHATLSAAAADVLSSVYGARVAFSLSSPAVPGVVRMMPSFGAAAAEASVSRIYNGNHTRSDEEAGDRLGADVARFVLRRAQAARR
jgi:membrane-associated phospholipid phosphatase